MIRVVVVPNLLEPATREVVELPFQPCLRFEDVVPPTWKGDPFLVVARHGSRVLDLSQPMYDRDHVLVTRTPGELATVKLIFLLVATTLLSASLQPRLPLVERGDERSPTYGFSGITPTRSEGTPIPTYFGKLRVGGQVLSEFVQARGPIGSWYCALVSLGHGPIHSVCGITEDTDPDAPRRSDGAQDQRVPRTLFINDTPATDYDGVELHVRLGTAEQQPIVGFNLDEQTLSIDAPLTGPPDSGSTYVYLLPFWPNSPGGTTGGELTDENDTWDTYGVAQSILDRDVDHFTVVTEFPQGLYSVSSSGAPYEFATSIAVRYVELDGGGVPITSGGLHGDGYVRLRPTPLFRAEVQGPFTLDFQFPFYDPQTYVLPTRSRLLSFDFGNLVFQEAWADRTSGLVYPSAWAAGSTTAPVSAEWWACLRPNGSHTGSNNTAFGDTALEKPAPVLDFLNTATNRGFRVVYRLQTFQVAAGQFRDRIVPVVQVGDGTTIKDYFDRNPNGQTASTTAEQFGDARWRGTIHFPSPTATDGPQSDWAYGAFTYEPNAVDTRDRLRIYCDGELVVEIVAVLDLMLPAASTAFNIGRRTGSTSGNAEYLKGDLDEVLIWSRTLTSDEVRDSYNTGFGTYHSTTTDLVAGYHFEESPPVVGAGGSIADFGLLGNTLTTRLGSSPVANNVRSGSLLGIMEKAQATNTIKRSRYRVEVMRALKDVTTTARVDDVRWSLLRTHVDEQFSYPGQALMAVRVKAQDQLSGSKPQLTAVIEGRLLPQWDGVSTTSPTLVDTYSRNPAWVLAFLHVNKIAGLGQFFEPRHLDVASFQELADRSDELVYDLRGVQLALDDTLGPITNLVYDGAAYGGLGQIEVEFLLGDPPTYLVPGTYVGFHGVPLPADYPTEVFQDINVGTIDGFLVVENLTAAQNGSAGGVLRLQYQRDATTTYADPPWGFAGDLQGALGAGNLTGILEGREPRFCYDGALDEARPAADHLQDVVSTCQTFLLREGRRVRVRVLKPEPVVDLLGQTQEIRDTFEMVYSSPSSRPNSYTASILDEAQLWDRAPLTLEDSRVAGSPDLGAIHDAGITYQGVTRRSQAYRLMQFLLNSNRLSLRSGKFTASIDALPDEVADVVQLAHDVVPRGISGRVEASSGVGAVTLDRTFVLEGGKTYDVSVRILTGGYSTRTVTSAAGTYVAGVDELTVTPDFDVQPEKGQAALLCEQGLELRARLTRLSLTKTLQREVEWAEYAEAAFATDEHGDTPDLPEDLNELVDSVGNAPARAPDNPTDLSARERLIRTPGSAPLPHVALTWTHAPATLELVARTEVYLAVDTGPWRLLGTAEGHAQHLLARLPDTVPGDRLRFAVVPVGRTGARRGSARASVVRLPVYARAVPPAAPLSFTAELAGDGAVYRIVPGDRRAGVVHEVRVGGWILGQPLATIQAGQTSVAQAPWVAGADKMSGDLAAPLSVRARAPDGTYSPAVALAWQPDAAGFGQLDDAADDTITEQAWEDYVDGWTDSTIPYSLPNSTLTDLQVHADGYLEFAGSALVGTFETPDVTTGAVPIGDRVFRQERAYLSAFAVAEQTPPLEGIDASFTAEEAGQLSAEGPISDLGDPEEPGQSTLAISVRLLDLDGTWGEWRVYRPGPASCAAAQFRLTLTRPNASHQVRVYRFSTKVTSMPLHHTANRTTDPSSPAVGQIWLRTDL